MSETTLERWLETDEAEDVAGSLRHAILCVGQMPSDPQAWKWFLLSVRAALQGACVCHLLTGTEPIGVVTPRNETEWLDFFEKQRTDPDLRPPRTHLMSLPDLLKALRRPNDRASAPAVKISDVELEWLSRIHREFRNQFAHFSPAGWSIELSGIPKLARVVARIALEILDHGRAFRHLDEDIRDAMRRDLHNLASFAPRFAERE